jgi:hypothetical protein
VREPDFQLCINRATGRQVDLMLSMSHIPTRVAAGGFSSTNTVQPAQGVWGAQAWEAFLQPIGVQLNAEAFRLSLAKADLDAAAADLPSGDGPLLLLAPAGGPADWPADQWQVLPERIRQRLPGLRTLLAGGGAARAQAARLASADVVLASESSTIELALMLGLPLVALGRSAAELPSREAVRGIGRPDQLAALDGDAVLQALGLV